MSDPNPSPKNPLPPEPGAQQWPASSEGTGTQPDYGQSPYAPQATPESQQPYGAPPQGYPDPNQPYGTPTQSYPDQPYGSQPYGGPAQGYSYGYGAQEPQSGYPGQSYDGGYAPQTYPQQSYAPTYPGQSYPPVGSTHPENKPTLGIIGFAGVAVFTVVLVVTSALMGHAIGAFVQTNGIEVLENADSTNPLFVALAQSIQGVSYLATFSVFAGIAAWITSIVAFARRAGRKYAVGGILLGIAAPIIAILTIGFVLAPYIQP